ncbi:MAG TPA: YggT family protein [Candidatus Dormibacteraeota bacterium]
MAVQQPAPTPAPASAPVAYAPAPTAMVEEGRYNFRAAAVVGFIVGVIDIFIAARFLGKLFGASTQSAFVSFIYNASSPMVAPFQGIFGNGGNKANSFETADLVAIVVYAVIGWGIVMLIRIVTAPRGTKPASS